MTAGVSFHFCHIWQIFVKNLHLYTFNTVRQYILYILINQRQLFGWGPEMIKVLTMQPLVAEKVKG